MAVTATTPVITDSQTLKEVVNCLTENVPIKTQGKCEPTFGFIATAKAVRT